MERLLLHTCCAPCSVYCVDSLRSEGIEPVSFWYNPNIHPYQEYRARRDTLVDYAGSIGLEWIVQEHYGLRGFVQAVAEDISHRCAYCYTSRLEETARYAAENGFTHFSTTLLVSPYQDHEGICRKAQMLADCSPDAAACLLPGRWGRSTAWPSSTGTSAPASARGRPRPGSLDCICRNTAAACFRRRTAMPSKSSGTGSGSGMADSVRKLSAGHKENREAVAAPRFSLWFGGSDEKEVLSLARPILPGGC